MFYVIIASDYSSLLHKTGLRTFHKVLFKLTMQVNHQYYILTQIDRGIEILKSLNDLEEVKHPMWKLTKDSRVFNEDDIFVLEGKVRNWQSETKTILNNLGINKESYELTFMPKETIVTLLDKRRALANEVQLGLDFLKKIEIEIHPEDEKAFLLQDFNAELDQLHLVPELIPVIKSRIDEIGKGLNATMPLAVIILSGSTLEGILLNLTKHNQELFNKANSTPKDKNGKVKPYSLWTLQNYIDVAYELGFLLEDTRAFSHVLRNFRNYIHPNAQINQRFIPDIHTAELCFQVLKAAIYQINKKIASNAVSTKKE